MELAWLGDPLVFPFFLSAQVNGGNLEVRGNVPNRNVREQALKLARLQSPMPVIDFLKENPSLRVRLVRMAPSQLQNTAQVSLREALPGQYRNLQVRASADGRVAIIGSLPTFEDKLTASKALRRVNGCSGVSNMVQVAGDPDGSLARALTRTRPPLAESTVVSSNPVPIPPNPGSAGSPPPSANLVPGTNNSQPIVVLPTGMEKTPASGSMLTIPSPTKNAPRLSQGQLKKRIEEACPNARDIRVTLTSATDVKVEIRARSTEEQDQLAGQILSLPELEPYKVDLNITVAQ